MTTKKEAKSEEVKILDKKVALKKLNKHETRGFKSAFEIGLFKFYNL